MSLQFADNAKILATAVKMVRAQAELDAAIAKCNKIILPLNEAVQEAGREFKAAADAASDHEAAVLAGETDLNNMLMAAELKERMQRDAVLAQGLDLSTVITGLPDARNEELPTDKAGNTLN